ncbi:MAG TPA: EthD domain-containing protein [Dehalococcoidia bacterium]|nr:EthD domain-containing protein [Dehalococcoidia bacterium]
MIKLVYCLRRLPSLSREEFQAYWRGTHGPLVRQRAPALGIRRYVQAHTLASPLNEALAASRGSGEEPFDGVAELWWESAESLAAATATPDGLQAAQELLADERRFIDLARSVIFVANEHPVVEG